MTDATEDVKSQLREAQAKMKVAESALRAANRGRRKQLIWSAIGGGMLLLIGGHWFPGYQLDSTARDSSSKAAMVAVGDVMAELCAARFMREPGVESRIVALNGETGDWSRANHIRDGAWAKSPDGERTSHATADKCRALIAERVLAKTGST